MDRKRKLLEAKSRGKAIRKEKRKGEKKGKSTHQNFEEVKSRKRGEKMRDGWAE